MKINNLDDLRKHAIQTINRLEKREIDITEAGVTSKLYENVISSVKMQLEYHKMTDTVPHIEFLSDSSNYELTSLSATKKISHEKTLHYLNEKELKDK